MYQKIVTEGIVLGRRAVGESNVIAALLTRELGLLKVSARSARAERSKLRYGLELLTVGEFCLLQGRSEWRITGVEKVSRALLHTGPLRRRSQGRVSRLLLRLVQGVEPSAALYESVAEGFRSLSRVEDDAVADAIECVLVLRILSNLGYLPHTPELTPFLERDFFALELSAEVQASRKLLIKAINESLEASGL